MFPTGNLVDTWKCPARFKATMINAGIPTIFVNAADIGYTGTELQDAINGDPPRWPVRDHPRPWRAAHGPDQDDLDEAATRQHTPKVAFVAPPKTTWLQRQDRRRRCRPAGARLSMGKLHHAMMGTAAVAIGTAAAIPGTLVNLAAGGGERNGALRPSLRHLRVGAEAKLEDGQWTVTKA
jgi:2-methylaconitate cis-trans-isomerase PrpF